MKAFKTMFMTVFFIAFAIGCSTTTQKENMLTAAGFKMVSADTPAKQAHLKSLPADKITPVQRHGTTYYTFPDQKRNVLYVGQEPQYQEYQKLRLQKQLANEQLEAAQMNQDAAWDVWGPWGGPGWGW